MLLKVNNDTFQIPVEVKQLNTANNKRNLQSVVAIQRAYLNLVVARPNIGTITVSDICKKAGINRTTFYAHYLDLDDLKRAIFDWMMKEYLHIFQEEADTGKHSYDFLKLFRHIRDNQLFYRIYFKLGFDFKDTFLQNGATDGIARHFYHDLSLLDYHIEFFAAGITAIIRKWLDGGCAEDPEDIAKVISDEYQKNNTL